jgi:hypothetical protein
MEITFKSSKLHPQGYIDFYAKDLDEAYKKGYFIRSMSTSEFQDRIDKSIRFRVREHLVAMYSTGKYNKFGNPFLAAVERHSLPKYNIFNTDGTKLLARGWYHLFKLLEGKKLKVDWRGL